MYRGGQEAAIVETVNRGANKKASLQGALHGEPQGSEVSVTAEKTVIGESKWQEKGIIDAGRLESPDSEVTLLPAKDLQKGNRLARGGVTCAAQRRESLERGKSVRGLWRSLSKNNTKEGEEIYRSGKRKTKKKKKKKIKH